LIPGAEEILELKDAGVVAGQVLLRVPDGGAETLETPVLLEPDPGATRTWLNEHFTDRRDYEDEMKNFNVVVTDMS
jgi:hypothetical protein